MMRKLFIPLLFGLLLSYGCAMVDFPEKELYLNPSEKELFFAAEFITPQSDSTATISVVSNRSWYAHLNDLDNPINPADTSVSVSWGELAVCGHTNLQHKTDTVLVTLTVYRNFSRVPVNGVVDFYSEGGKKACVRISQLAAVYHLNAEADRDMVACKEDSVKISIDCNTAWTAEIIEATAEATLSDSLGFDPKDIFIRFAENVDVGAQKTAKVKLSASGCPDMIIQFTQNGAEPYVEWSSETTGKLNAWEKTGKVSFRTNCAWTIEAEDSTLTDIVFDRTSGVAGVKGDQEVKFSFKNTLVSPDTAAIARIILKTDYSEPLTLTVSQRPQLIINLAKNDFSPQIPGVSSAVETTHTFTYQGRGYSISLFLMRFITNKLYFVSATDDGNGYIKFPIISGAALKGIEIYIKGQSTYYRMTSAVFDNDGNQMSNQYSFATPAVSETHNFIIGENGSKPKSDTQYMLKGLAKQTCCINKIVLSYE